MAVGPGVRVQAAGISLGGVLAAWAGENPIAGATAISPFMGVKAGPGPLELLVAGALELLPNFFVWWDLRVGANNPATPPYAYARYPSRRIAAQLSIGGDLSRRATPRVPRPAQRAVRQRARSCC